MQVKEAPPATKPINANAALLLLLGINLFNYIDRQVLAAVEPEIRAELLHGVADDQAKFRMGLLSTAFLVSYMLLAPVFGWLADRWSRWWLVGIGVMLWSLASGASGIDWGLGLAAAYWALLITRCFVGVGEGAYGPIAPAMIADLYPVERRGQVMSWFYLAIPVGGALGYAFGEVMMTHFGWRWAFYAVVPPGILLGIWAFFMREPPRGRAAIPRPDAGSVELSKETAPASLAEGNADTAITAMRPKEFAAGAAHVTMPRQAGLRQYLALLKIPSYFFNSLGMTAMTFAIGGLAYWMPAYLDERSAPGLGPVGPRTLFGALTALAGLLATLSGGILGDLLRPRFSGAYFLVSGIALLLGFPAVLGFIYTPFPLAWLFVFLAVFCLFFNTGPTNTILANVTPAAVRASGFALNILIIHALGDAISPPIMGLISDQSANKTLHWAFIVVSAVMLVGGVAWLAGMPYLQRDTQRAEGMWSNEQPV